MLARIPCPHCGEPNLAHDFVCLRCGADLQTASPVPTPTVLMPTAPPGLSSGPDELCPVCRRVMVPAAELQDGLESSALTADRSEFEYFAYRGGGGVGAFMLFDMLVDMVVNAIFGAARRRRLRRVARDYPASLVCGGCGHIVKRRF